MALIKNTTYDNVFYDNVLKKLRSIITTDRATNVYISPNYQDQGSFSVRLWGSSSDTDAIYASEWRKVYNTEVVIYTVGDESSESFYEQLYSDSERLYQLLFNNKHISSGDFAWYDGQVGSVSFDEFIEGEDEIENLHLARFSFSCRITRAD